MGWKNVKLAYDIPDNIIVHVENGQLALGVEFIPVYYILSSEGNVSSVVPSSFTSIFDSIIDNISKDKRKFKEAFESPDSFDELHSVWTLEDGKVVEKKAEKIGFPNVTTEGELMFENSHFSDKKSAVIQGIKSLEARIKNSTESINFHSAQLNISQANLIRDEDDLAKLLDELE